MTASESCAFLGLCAADLLLLTVLVDRKLAKLRPGARPTVLDALLLAALNGVFWELMRVGVPGAGFAAVAVFSVLLGALWLDSVLFRIYTIELGPGGVADIVIASLYRELSQMKRARRLLRSSLAFSFLPVLALLVHVAAIIELGSATAAAIIVPSGWLLALVLRTGNATLWMAVPLWLAFEATQLGRIAPLSEDARWLCSYGGIALMALAIFAFPREGRSGLVWPFLFPRRLPVPRDFTPDPEHAHALELQERPPRPSDKHGLLRGRDVLLLTVESMGRAHLDMYSRGGARMPFVERLLAEGIQSRHHFCLSPLTNNAHHVLYASRYTPEAGPGGVEALRRAGYQTMYLSPAPTRHYGLRKLLEGAGFELILDEAALTRAGRAPLGGDHALLDPGAGVLAALRDERPMFLHVQTAQTHVPYQVVDASRFHRFDSESDYGRFLNGLEETDWILGELVNRLEESGVVHDPVVIVTGDHGQAFGTLGYHSHGSAVVRSEIEVPFAIRHPSLGKGKLGFSSHFDVLPTVLDLLGIESQHPTQGESLFLPDRRQTLVLWAGHPSKTTTSNFGLVLGDQKYMLDLVVDRCYEMDWDETWVRELSDDAKTYYAALVSAAFKRCGLR